MSTLTECFFIPIDIPLIDIQISLRENHGNPKYTNTDPEDIYIAPIDIERAGEVGNWDITYREARPRKQGKIRNKRS